MKDLSFGSQVGSFEEWVTDCLRTIEQASREDVETAIADFTVTGTLTPVRTINAGTATATDLRNVLCTLITDIQKQGQKRTNG